MHGNSLRFHRKVIIPPDHQTSMAFGSEKQPSLQPPSREIELERRLKVLEENLTNVRRKLLLNEQNDLNRHKRNLLQEKTTQEEINELKKENEMLKRNIREIISELKSAARKEDVEVLKKYIDLWDPTKFVTEETVERIVEDAKSTV